MLVEDGVVVLGARWAGPSITETGDLLRFSHPFTGNCRKKRKSSVKFGW